MKGLFADIKHALRLYWRTPGSSLIAVGVLAIGMAFVTSFLSLYVDLVLKPNPGYEESGDLVTIGQSDGQRVIGLPLGILERAADEMTSLEALAGLQFTLQQNAEGADRRGVAMVTRDFFGGIRPKLHLGRGFEPEDHDAEAEPVVILSYEFWRDQLESDPDVLGTTFELELAPMIRMRGPDGQPAEPEEDITEFRVAGVLAPGVTALSFQEPAFWIPYERAVPLVVLGSGIPQMLPGLALQAYGRLAAGAPVESVVRELESRYGEDFSGDYFGRSGFRLDAIEGLVRDLNVQRDSKRQLQVFLAASILLALVAAANVSLFLLARAPGRRRELAIRMAVGAPLKRLARQLASESAVLVVVAALAGFVLSLWLSGFLRGLAFLQRAEWQDVTLLDWRVLSLVGPFLFALTVLVSLAPVLGLKRLGIGASSRQVNARASVAQRIAGTVQITIAGTLGGAAIAFAWYLGGLIFGDPGYESEDRLRVQYFINIISREGLNFAELAESQIVERARRRDAIESIPGVSAAAFGSPAPGEGQGGFNEIPHPTNPDERIRVVMGDIDSRYIDVLGLRLLYGRAPTDDDVDVAVVNQAFARTYWGREDVVGESIRLSPVAMGPQPEVIGVLEDLSFAHPAADVKPMLWRTQNSPFLQSAIVETTLTAADLQQALEPVISYGPIENRVGSVMPLSDLRSSILAPDRARGLLTIGTAALVVILAAFGFYGTQRYLVGAGRREYAIRASLGAGPRALGRLVFSRGILLAAPGLVAGSLLAFILVAWLRDDYLSREISPGTVTAVVVAGLVLLLAAASLSPARQARRTQPAPLLREE